MLLSNRRTISSSSSAGTGTEICLSTTPSRINHLTDTLKSLFAQSRSPQGIRLHIPEFSKREHCAYEIPPYLDDLEGVEIIRCDDLGPATKLIPALRDFGDDQKILVVDDDPAICVVVGEALRRQGHKVKTAASIRERSALIDSFTPDVLITDVMLPDGDGLDGVADILDRNPDLNVIILSAQNTLNTAIRATEKGAFEYLPKPFDLNELTRAVSDALGTRDSVEGLEGMSTAAAYNASKGGVVLMTKNMAIDYGREGIRVNCLCPGLIETPMTADRFGSLEPLHQRLHQNLTKRVNPGQLLSKWPRRMRTKTRRHRLP